MELRCFFPGFRSKALTLSYDDGQKFDRRLVEIFNHYQLKSTFHLVSGLLDQDPWVSGAELRTLYAGHEISCHSLTHPFLSHLPATEVMREVWLDRAKLEELAGYPIQGLSYPYGSFNSEIVALCRAAGFIYSRTTRSTGSFGLPDDFLLWDPTCHHRQALQYLDAFLKNTRDMSLFYVWGHSHNFDTDQNWSLVEDFCRNSANRPEIWYATNIEVCRYIQAVRSLVISCNGRLVFNPSAQTVCIMRANHRCELPPGTVAEL